MKRLLPIIIGIVVIFTLAYAFNLRSENASAATASHLVISEIQIDGIGAGTSSHDFVELYNPTNSNISLDGMRLGKRTSGSSSANVVIFSDGLSVPARGYFLWCNTALNGTYNCDASGSGTLSDDNSLALINGSLASGLVIDAVTFGTPGTSFGEGTSLDAPDGGASVERKANSASTALSMAIGGLDELLGNGEDTDNNSIDFILRDIPQPQNSNSATEPNSASPTPSTEPTLTQTPTQTIEPSNTPIPTATPTPNSPSLTPTNSPTPTIIPTITPTSLPSVTPTISPSTTPLPSPSLSPTPTNGKVIVQGPIFTCTINYKTWKIFNKTILIPQLTCIKN